MKYILVFAFLGLSLLYLAATSPLAAAPLTWTGLAFAGMAAAYAGLGPRVLAKRPDGALPWWSRAFFLPYLLATWGVWRLQRHAWREAPCSEIAPGLWLGRRPFAYELPPRIGLVVDLTAEFPVARGVASGRRYLCVPCLDATAPDLKAFDAAVRTIAACAEGVYIHCAVGRGRSATVAVAVLVARGLAATPEEAEAHVRRARPQIRLNHLQRQLLTAWAAGRGTGSELPAK